MYKKEHYNLLNLTNEQNGYLITQGIDVETFLLSGITSIEISKDFSLDLKKEFFCYNTKNLDWLQFAPSDYKTIKKTYKLRKRKGNDKNVISLAKDLLK